MKFGVRKPSVKKSISARTTGRAKRKLKKLANPLYGKKGMGWIKNPKRAFKNKTYRKTTISAKGAMGCIVACIYYPIYWCCILTWWILKYTLLLMWGLCVLIINGIIALIGLISNRTVVSADEQVDGASEVSENIE